jgi:hypothetical protein
MRLTWDGRELWKRVLPAHHDVELAPNGDILTLTQKLIGYEELDAKHPTDDHYLTRLSNEGELLEQVSFLEILNSSPQVFEIQPIPAKFKHYKKFVDLFHSNSIESIRYPELAKRDPIYSPGNVLVSIRHQDTLMIVDWENRRVVWAWGQGRISGPHDASMLPNGNILAFDNGLSRGWSRVIEIDPLSMDVVWSYRAENKKAFYSMTRGSAQRLTNGNTLITHSHGGRVLEVTPDNRIVWLYQTPVLTDKQEPSIIVRTRRFEGLTFAEMERRVQIGQPLPIVD